MHPFPFPVYPTGDPSQDNSLLRAMKRLSQGCSLSCPSTPCLGWCQGCPEQSRTVLQLCCPQEGWDAADPCPSAFLCSAGHALLERKDVTLACVCFLQLIHGFQLTAPLFSLNSQHFLPSSWNRNPKQTLVIDWSSETLGELSAFLHSPICKWNRKICKPGFMKSWVFLKLYAKALERECDSNCSFWHGSVLGEKHAYTVYFRNFIWIFKETMFWQSVNYSSCKMQHIKSGLLGK